MAQKEHQRLHYLANKEKYKQRAREWKAINPEKVVESSRRRYVKKKDHILAVTHTYYRNNKEAARERSRDWVKRNPGKAASYCAARRTRILEAQPPWVDPVEIQVFYEEAARLSSTTGVKHHVDHIHPLKGKNFRGLHVPWNLQVIPAKQNHIKSNKLLPEYL
jgi:hypothetical protein